jgi:hypothetical protein
MRLVMIPQEHPAWDEEHPYIYITDVPPNRDKIRAHWWFPISRLRGNLYLEFHSLARSWQQEMSFSSSPTEIAMHPAYQRIIGMGPVVIPLILHELETEPHLWFWALKTITGEDPIKPEQRGKIQEMAQAWLQWGKEHDYQW